ncbi:MAG UNVERIFIED_CONTAM: hypothetical protein LVR18_51430 [Planctomycetaceae bacterium]
MSPRLGSLSNDCCESSGSIGSDERSSVAQADTSEAAGIVPAIGSLSNDCCESSGSSGCDERSGVAQADTSEAAGIVPATGVAEYRLLRIFGF